MRYDEPRHVWTSVPFTHSRRARCVCVYYCSTYQKMLFAWGEGDSGGHVLRETTSQGLCGRVCPSRTSERGGEGDCVKEGGGGEGERAAVHGRMPTCTCWKLGKRAAATIAGTLLVPAPQEDLLDAMARAERGVGARALGNNIQFFASMSPLSHVQGC